MGGPNHDIIDLSDEATAILLHERLDVTKLMCSARCFEEVLVSGRIDGIAVVAVFHLDPLDLSPSVSASPSPSALKGQMSFPEFYLQYQHVLAAYATEELDFVGEVYGEEEDLEASGASALPRE